MQDFFLNPQHWIYTSKGTSSEVGPDSVYHIAQLQVLFEDKHFHYRTYPAIRQLMEDGFLQHEEVAYDGSTTMVVWRRNVRYTRRPLQHHVRLLGEYSSETINKASGNYAETLVLLGLRGLHMDLVGRSTREYRGRIWTDTEHDLDFILEKDGVGFGVEVKNTWVYIPPDELTIKLKMCDYLGTRPLFIVRNRHSGQWNEVKNAGGLLYIFKSKILPPGQEDLASRMWRLMRLPVVVWQDWPGQFYPLIGSFLHDATV